MLKGMNKLIKLMDQQCDQVNLNQPIVMIAFDYFDVK